MNIVIPLESFNLFPYRLFVMTIIIVLLTAIVASLYSWLFSNFRKKNLPPRLKISMIQIVSHFLDGSFIPLFYNTSKKLGSIFYVIAPLRFSPLIVCCDMGLAKLLLTGDTSRSLPEMDKPRFLYKFFDNVSVGRPSLETKCTVGHGWQWARKGVAASFSINNLTAKMNIMNQAISMLMKQLKEMSDNQIPIDITSFMIHFTIDFLTLSMFGECFHTSQDFNKSSKDVSVKLSEGKRFLDELNIATKEFVKKQTADPLRQYYFWNKDVRRAKKAKKYIHEFSLKLLQKYRDTHTSEEIENDSSIMGNLMKSPYPSDEDRCADIVIFLLAGHDTTGCTLAWTILEVAKNPQILQKIRVELDQVNPDPLNPFDKNSINQCEYLCNVIQESLRLWPATAVAGLRLTDREIDYKGFCIPKNSVVHISNFSTMRSNIQRPDEFIPERWQQGGTITVKKDDDDETHEMVDQSAVLKDQFFPFSLGKRNCVGQNLALLELKLSLATIFRSYEFKIVLDDNYNHDNNSNNKNENSNECRVGLVDYEYYMTMKPTNVLLTVHERK